jgi:oligoendopeptidase F
MPSDTARARTAEDAGPLPEWNLADLYPAPDSPELARDLEETARAAEAFEAARKGRVAALDGPDLAAAIADYEWISERLGRVTSYAYLRYAADVGNPANGRFFQSMQERANDITRHLLFFELEINRLADDRMAALLADAAMARYRPWVENLRVHRPHQLSDEAEQLLHDKTVTGRAAWVRLFDETLAGLRFPVEGKALTLAEALNLLSSPEREVRKAAAHAIGDVLDAHARLFALITNTLAKDKEIEDRWRKFPTPMAARHLSNLVEEEVVEALRAAVREAYPRLSHRYYRMKAKWLGGDHLDYWDRNAPLRARAERIVPWDEARDTVLDAYGRFSPAMRDIARRFFDQGWIDAPVRPGKEPGAFSHPTVPSVHPYILMNYQGKVRDVMTLAHELGHGVHQVLAAPQGYLLADTPLTLAETASVFGEMLTFRAMLDAETDPARRHAMLAHKVEDMLNTVVRQIAFYEFEIRVHTERRQGELPLERLAEIWLDVQRESLGPALRFDDRYRNYWAYIPHFIHSPFYVYAYAFGDCLVNALYAVYQDGSPGFAERYLDMLRAGGSRRYRELLAPFELDAADPTFWSRGLGVIEGFIDELAAAEAAIAACRTSDG